MTAKLKYTDRYDYIIGVLYKLKAEGKSGSFSLKQLLQAIDNKVDYEEVFQTGKYLEAQGYINAYQVIGDVWVEITPNGIIHWENKTDKFILNFTEFVQKQNIEEVIEKMVNVFEEKDSVKNTRNDIFKTLDIILSKTKELNKQNPDLLIDTQILKMEFEKEIPDNEVILNKLYSIDQMPSLRKEVFFIKKILNIR